MLGTSRLLTFAFRALVLLLLIPILWISVAERYNEALVALAAVLLPDGLSLDALGSHILIEDVRLAKPVSIEGFTLHYGLVLLAVLVLAAVGVSPKARVGWLVGMGAGVFVLHIVGVALLARGVAWASVSDSAESSGDLVFSLFAIFWGLLPALIGGAWAFLYWLPRASAQAQSAVWCVPVTFIRASAQAQHRRIDGGKQRWLAKERQSCTSRPPSSTRTRTAYTGLWMAERTWDRRRGASTWTCPG